MARALAEQPSACFAPAPGLVTAPSDPDDRPASPPSPSEVKSTVAERVVVHCEPTGCLSGLFGLLGKTLGPCPCADSVPQPCPPPEQFVLLKCIGQGTFGRVHLTHWHDKADACCHVALKSASKRTIARRKQATHLNNERLALAQLSHPFIVELQAAFQTPGHVHLSLEWCPGGNLLSLVRRTRGLDTGLCRFYLSEVWLALTHMHGLGMIYRDLKPENIVLDPDGHVRLVDFGLVYLGGAPGTRLHLHAASDESQDQGQGQGQGEGVGLGGPHPADGPAADHAEPLPTRWQFDRDDAPPRRALTVCGSDDYLAPEVLCRRGYDWGVDLWALGCLAYELLTGRTPFRAAQRHDTFRRIVSCEYAPHQIRDPAGRELVEGLLRLSRDHRLGCGGAAPATKPRNSTRTRNSTNASARTDLGLGNPSGASGASGGRGSHRDVPDSLSTASTVGTLSTTHSPLAPRAASPPPPSLPSPSPPPSSSSSSSSASLSAAASPPAPGPGADACTPAPLPVLSLVRELKHVPAMAPPAATRAAWDAQLGDGRRKFKAHRFWRGLDWDRLACKRVPPPHVPRLADRLDTSNFAPLWTNSPAKLPAPTADERAADDPLPAFAGFDEVAPPEPPRPRALT